MLPHEKFCLSIKPGGGDFQTEGGEWMVFQVRDDVEPRENFQRNWEDYKVGFGDFDREFWLGKNRSIH